MHPVVVGGDLQAGQVVAALILEDHGAAAVADAAVCAASGGGGGWRDEGDEARRGTECGWLRLGSTGPGYMERPRWVRELPSGCARVSYHGS